MGSTQSKKEKKENIPQENQQFQPSPDIPKINQSLQHEAKPKKPISKDSTFDSLQPKSSTIPNQIDRNPVFRNIGNIPIITFCYFALQSWSILSDIFLPKDILTIILLFMQEPPKPYRSSGYLTSPVSDYNILLVGEPTGIKKHFYYESK